MLVALAAAWQAPQTPRSRLVRRHTAQPKFEATAEELSAAFAESLVKQHNARLKLEAAHAVATRKAAAREAELQPPPVWKPSRAAALFDVGALSLTLPRRASRAGDSPRRPPRFATTLDKNQAAECFKLLMKYQPEDKATKADRLKGLAEARPRVWL